MSDLIKSIREMWLGLSGPRQLSLVATTLFSLAVLISVVMYSSKPKLSLLYAKLAPEEAAKVVDYLQGRNVPFELKDNGGTIMVPAGKVYEIRLDLAAEGIPRTADTAGGVGFEIFDSPKLGMSDFMQRANYHRALQGELARTIHEMDEVEQARVMLVVPEQRLFSNASRSSKASVFLKLKPGRVLSESHIQAIRFLVANGVEGLEPNRVTIVDSSGRGLALDQKGNSLGSLSTAQLDYRMTLEEHLRQKAQTMLDQVMGPGQAVVRISAEVNFDSVQETSETFDPKGSVLRSENTGSETSSSQTEQQAGAAGTASNVDTSNTSSTNPNTKSQKSRETTKNQYEINRVVETRQRAIGMVRQLSVAVFVNARKTGTGDAATVNPRTPQEIKSLEEVVKTAVGFTSNTARQDSIYVQELEFADLFAQGGQAEEKVDIIAEATKWMPYLSQGFLILLAIAVMLYFRSIIKGAARTEQSADGEFAELLGRFENLERMEREDAARRSAEERGASVLTVDQLNKLIGENPTNTAQAIRQWMAKN